ncbi:dephospho-CoA kinase [Catalinimonas alkaloidigena]|uniref:Dephospho-CoA kinase n=1 Tax=Catalinimonas alkaloidigena TaxID=1075417 RepID=A0A1G9DEA6_9BACT|nr:dephospho-CoA kinase [Catalinimonas alkaloidigena]SDK62231.1 dephospho-CoA kinase [Catalinimonas alkaloidigena]
MSSTSPSAPSAFPSATPSKPLQIGITGGIGSGKSLVCRLFALLRIPIYEADDRARWLMNHDPQLTASVRSAFGNEAYTPDGQLNRPWLSARVFSDPEQVAQLNALVHPRVADDYGAWVAEQRSPYVIKEAALLYEAGSWQQLDQVVVVYAGEALRIARIRQRDPHRSAEEIRAIMARQLSEDEKVKRADHVIYNDERQLVIPQVLALHNQWWASRQPS